MPRNKAADETVRRSADAPRAASAAELGRLLAAADGPIDTSDIPERDGPGRPAERDVEGRLARRPKDVICVAILDALGRTGMNRHQLWQAAREFKPTISQSAVYEYLRGGRDIEASNLSAMVRAAGLKFARPRMARKPPSLMDRLATLARGPASPTDPQVARTSGPTPGVRCDLSNAGAKAGAKPPRPATPKERMSARSQQRRAGQYARKLAK